MKSNPNPSFYPILPYELLFSCTSIDKKRKEKKKKKKNNNQKLKEKKRKEKLNNDLAILPSHDTIVHCIMHPFLWNNDYNFFNSRQIVSSLILL